MIKKDQANKILNFLIKDAEERIERTEQKGVSFWDNFDAWRQMAIDCLEQIYMPNHRNVNEFTQIRFSNPSPDEKSKLVTFIVGLTIAKERLKATRFSVETYWNEDAKIANYPIIFLSASEKARKLVDKLKIFLTNLGSRVIFISDEANLNLSIGNKVNYYMSLCNCGIALITADEELPKGEKINRRNIDHELGLMTNSSNIEPRIVILKERSVQEASNHRENVHIPFNRATFADDVFSNLIKELRGFGYF